MLKKKVCVVIPTHWSWILGGAEYQVSLITKNLADDDNFDVTVLSRNVSPSFQPENYTLKAIAKGRFLARYSKLFDIKKILSALQSIQPDIIYQRVGCSYTGACAWYARRKKIPMVWHISHDMDVTPAIIPSKSVIKRLLSTIDKHCLEYGLRHATHIIAQTEYQAQLLKQHYGRTADQIIRNFHPLPNDDQAVNKGNRVKIVWIANFKPTKRPELFVRLARELEHLVDAHFIMMGNGGSSKQYGRLINEIETIKSLDYLGEQPQEKVNEILSGAHLLVNTSEYEGFSNTFIQAWMREVPVISLTVDPDDLIKKQGLGVCAGNYENLKKTVIDLIKSPERRNEMGRKGKQYAYENHSMENISKINDTLKQLLLTARS